jgi:hypothetical protein
MPKETVHYGMPYVEVVVPATKEMGEYRYTLDPDEATKAIAAGTVDESQVLHGYTPAVQVYWSKPSDAVRFDEDPEGFVQLGVEISELEFSHYVQMFLEAPQDAANRTFYTRKMTRIQLNSMIRVLKRARDAAYGSDE